jgi:hypothetical protein
MRRREEVWLLYFHAVAAGKPEDCSSAIEEYITIYANRVKHPKDTYGVKASGDSMKDVWILERGLLIGTSAPFHDDVNDFLVLAVTDRVEHFSDKGDTVTAGQHENYDRLSSCPRLTRSSTTIHKAEPFEPWFRLWVARSDTRDGKHEREICLVKRSQIENGTSL